MKPPISQRPPDGHTPTGVPYWVVERKDKSTHRLLGSWPAYPAVLPVEPPDDDPEDAA